MLPAFLTARVIAYIAILSGLAGGFFYYRHQLVEHGIQIADARVAEVTKDAQTQRAKELAEQAEKDRNIIADIQDSYEIRLKASQLTTDDLNRRLRAYASARSGGLALPGDPATPAGADVPASGPSRVERAVEGVVRATGQDSVKVQALQAYIVQECH